MSLSGLEKEKFMLIVSGPTRNAPFLQSWTDFKDNLRKFVKNQPGWVEVMPGGQRGDMQGWARIETKDDAEIAYSM